MEPEKRVSATFHKVKSTLDKADISFSICGGLAVSHHGFERYTKDVDIIVNSVNHTKATLLKNGFVEFSNEEKLDAVVDPRTKVKVDLIQAGKTLNANNSVLFPKPVNTFVSLPQLISLKLDSARAKDVGDVGELIKHNKLPRDLEINPSVKHKYEKIWDATFGKKNMIEAFCELIKPEELVDKLIE